MKMDMTLFDHLTQYVYDSIGTNNENTYCVSSYSLIQCYLRFLSMFNSEVHQKLLTNDTEIWDSMIKDGTDEINLMFIQNRLEYKKEYADKMVDYTTMHKFKGTSEETDILKNMISKFTNGMINDFEVKFDDPNLIAVFINAIYFSQKWNHEFDLVENRVFTKADGKETNCSMITIRDEYFSYYDNGDTQLIEIPYQNNNYVMGLIKTDEKFPTLSELSEMQEVLNSRKINLIEFPKFEIRTKIKNEEIFSLLGVSSDVFKVTEIDNIGFNDPSGLNAYCSHECVINVNEKGTDAAADTRFFAKCRGYQPRIDFVCDKPFMFYIAQGDNMLFHGYYNN